ncbi:MAG: TIGR03790 family protein [Acidobacteriota bacterium]
MNRVVLFSVVLAACSSFCRAAVEDPNTVLILVNDQSPAETGTGGLGASVFVGQHYAQKRGIPSSNILHLNIPVGGNNNAFDAEFMTFASFDALIRQPIKTFLQNSGLKNQIKFIVPTYGIPSALLGPPVLLPAARPESFPLDGFSIDSFLASMYAGSDDLFITNPYAISFASYARAHFRSWTNPQGWPMYLVTRLDGPSAVIASALVDKAMQAEASLSFTSGKGYFDWQHNDNSTVDQTMKRAYDLSVSRSFPSVLNDQTVTGTLLTSAPNTLWAWGWYSSNNTCGCYSFVNGAVGAQLTSYTANRIRVMGTGTWVPEWLNAGITATWGATGEPYSSGYAKGDNLLNHFWYGYNFAESAYLASPGLNWMMVFVGDPLYSPPLFNTAVSSPSIPRVSVSGTKTGQFYSGKLTASISLPTSPAVAGVTFLVEGYSIADEDKTAPYSVTVDTDSDWNGPLSVTAYIRYANTQTLVSDPVAIIVYNPTASAAFVALDSATQGRWKAKYGVDGYSIASDSTQNPPYVTPGQNGTAYTWDPSPTDVRALQRGVGTGKIASTWYSFTPFSVDLPFTDTAVHQVAIYMVDWDGYGPRKQTVEVLDTNNTVLDSRVITNFGGGQYLVWNLSGHVKIQATPIGSNAVISGVFFGVGGTSTPPVTPTSAASFVALDSATQGGWKTKYGVDGFSIASDATQNPSYVTPLQNGTAYTWDPAATDVRALQRGTGTSKIASTWYSFASFFIDLPFTDTSAHQVAIYMVDWDAYGPRKQTVDVLDANDNVLDSRVISNFGGGQYLVWNLTGHVKIRATPNSSNAVISGIFFGLGGPSAPVTPPTSLASFVVLDKATQGAWKAKYGVEGFSIAADSTQNPSYVTPSQNGTIYTWDPAATDVRALQRGTGTGKIASTWYSFTPFAIDLPFTDTATHQVAIYMVDWDGYGPRNQTVEILDANNNVLDSRAITSFGGGQYLVWNLTGPVKIRATPNGSNAVISGVFFGLGAP